uniref:CFEM domain-containing protein n=1 Tax=Bionectria ochroleuca TaxID=29856 RepID=A0A0B7K9D7_BIOOC
MKFSLVAIAFAAVVSAQSRSDIPECALGCLDDVVKSKTSCSTDDFACICKNVEAFKGDAASCVIKKCGAETALSAFPPFTGPLH